MSAYRRTGRRVVIRSGRRFLVCGLRRSRRARAAPVRSAADAGRRAGLLPGATFLLVVLFSAYVFERPPHYPQDPGRQVPIVGVSGHTIEDLAAATR
jgi:hypothetical protein